MNMLIKPIQNRIAERCERSVCISEHFLRSNRPIAFVGICVGLLLPLCLVGCEAASSGEEGHHHHVHQRLTFTEAVGEIQRRSKRFTSREVSNDAALQAWKKQKLLGVIRQLPELAADTELKKKSWDQVNTISKELLEILHPQDGMSNERGLVDAARFTTLIGELEQLVSSTESVDSSVNTTSRN